MSAGPVNEPAAYRLTVAMFLAQSVDDLARRAKGQQAPILSPHRHLIGEYHNQSRFEDAVAAWGWGAARMAEGLQTSALVDSSVARSNIGFSPSRLLGVNPYFRAKLLENIHTYTYTYTMQFLSVLAFKLDNLSQIAVNLADDQRDEDAGLGGVPVRHREVYDIIQGALNTEIEGT